MKSYEIYFENESKEQLNELETLLEQWFPPVSVNPIKKFFVVHTNENVDIYKICEKFNVTIKDVTGLDLVERYRHI